MNCGTEQYREIMVMKMDLVDILAMTGVMSDTDLIWDDKGTLLKPRPIPRSREQQ